MDYLKRTWADISLDNLNHNYQQLRAKIPSGCRLLGVVKADAYGHGAVPISRHLCELGAEFLAVSNLEEAMQLRRGGIRRPILILAIRRLPMRAIWSPWDCGRRSTASSMPARCTRSSRAQSAASRSTSSWIRACRASASLPMTTRRRSRS